MSSGIDIKSKLAGLFEQVLSDYGVNIAMLVIGIILGWYLKRVLADTRYEKLNKQLLAEKDKRITDLNTMVSERLNKIVVDEESKTFFRKVKRYFKQLGKNR